MEYNEIKGDLITLANNNMFDIIVHGCNCFCKMARGLAPQMAEAFGCNLFELENEKYKGDINKLGQIDYHTNMFNFTVVNAYTQYHWSTETKPLDYEALTLCLRKINHIFNGKHIGLPQIGCHLAGGDWNIVKEIIKKELKDCKVTIVIYDKN
mgnify:CR=1 FL=1